MGVTGLWTLLEPVSKPVALETLENKTLAVDVSIWLHQATKGFRDAQGNPLPNAHLLGLCHRICKLLFYKIKPVFVFDGGVPFLKRQVMASRQTRKSTAQKNSDRAAEQILKNYITSEILNHALNKKKKVPRIKKKVDKDMFELPPLPAPTSVEENENSESSGVDSSDMEDAISTHVDGHNIHTVDFNSEAFRNLPPETQHEILLELKETRKQNSWNKLHEMPSEAQDFSGFQMQRLLKRRNLQQRLNEVTKEMNQSKHNFLNLESNQVAETRRIDSDNTTEYILIKKLNPGPSEKSSKNSQDKPTEEIQLDNDDDLTQEELLAIMSTEKKVIEMSESDDDSDLEDVVPTKSVLSVAITKDLEYNESEDMFADVFQSSAPIVREAPVVVMSSTCQVMSDVSDSSDEDKPEIFTSEGGNVPESSSANLLRSDTLKLFDKTDTEHIVVDNSTKSSNSPSIAIDVEAHFVQEANHERLDVQDFSEDLSVNNLPEEDEIIQEPVNQEKVVQIELKEVTESIQEEIEEPKIVQEVPKEVKEAEKKDGDEVVRVVPGPSRAELEALSDNIDREQLLLIQQYGREQRLATNITDQMYLEAQELLRLFGIPYLVAPMEAEAQCAFLDQAELTDGTITDDSDVWLFGGRRVYKNFFNQGKYVEYFQADEIKRVFRLEREQLIQMALLTGSDYTEGVETVGPVTALEIMAEFPNTEGLNGLERFRDWLHRVQSKKNAPPENKIRQKIRHLKLNSGFPNSTVVEAYLRPEVNESRARFTWNCPDRDALRDYLYEKIGWNRDKFNSVVVPVLDKFNSRDTQLRIDSFFARFPAKTMTTPNISKRVLNAIQRADFRDEEQGPSPPKSRKEPPKGGAKSRVGAKKSAATVPVASTSSSGHEEIIWQKEMDKRRLESNKQKAIELLRVACQARVRGGRPKRAVVKPVVIKEAQLSESDSN